MKHFIIDIPYQEFPAKRVRKTSHGVSVMQLDRPDPYDGEVVQLKIANHLLINCMMSRPYRSKQGPFIDPHEMMRREANR